ncbi:hypothetical protein [Bacillus taeanensis]|uniref:Uncharacterized protein n=1 Tax=Bacillus taeanensis TaxID=273032 RepID=A0A366XXX2_9BACI|nr:hypothetical protein [Bacillus taeanensis]RBW68791.1 hypothetical protein DS031_14690 [Bacillus taeanensis]
MSYHDYYHVFNDHIGECIEIRCYDGNVHRGYIERCDEENVYLRPLGNEKEDFGGHGTYFFGFGLGIAAIALATIAAFSFSPFFFW